VLHAGACAAEASGAAATIGHNRAMITIHLRYQIDPEQLDTFVEYRDAPFPFINPEDNYILLRAANATRLRPVLDINGTVLPPFINAAELFSPISTADVGTEAQDGKYGIMYS
jgi:hypothetical protein